VAAYLCLKLAHDVAVSVLHLVAACAACCSVLLSQYISDGLSMWPLACYSVLQCVAVCSSVFHSDSISHRLMMWPLARDHGIACLMLQCPFYADRKPSWQRKSMLQCGAVWCSMQYVAVCCSVL